jgi:peptidoglycan/xylan/chitin deacetylase (PgdA/CDA1 family)
LRIGRLLNPLSLLALDTGSTPLGRAERFALDLLLDLARLLAYSGSGGGEGDVVRLLIVESGARAELASLRGRAWTIVAGNGVVTIERPLLTFVTQIAGAVAEQRTTAADRFGRVPSSENELAHAEAERSPVVSQIGRALAAAVRRAAGRRPLRFVAPWPDGHRWAAALTHDLDVVSWWPAFTALRLAELARKGQLLRMLRVVGAAAATGGRNVVWEGVREVLDIEAHYGARSTWFVLCGTPSLASARAGDLTYSPESKRARRILEAVRAGGHEIDLHGSFATSDTPTLFAEQRDRLAALVGQPPLGVRQHYLRLRPGTTYRDMADAGFVFDSSSGFADRNGFRLGVADVVPMWSDAAASPLPLDEVPFAWMDRALSKYRGVEDPAAWVKDALELADRCREVDGLWVGVWHPNLTSALGFPGALDAYEDLVAALVEHSPWLPTLSEAVAWRRARRSVRAVGIDAAGEVHLAATEGDAAHQVSLEDADGRPVGSHVAF